jgi:hypothetical protein
VSDTSLNENVQVAGGSHEARAHTSISQFLQDRFARLSEEIEARFSVERDVAAEAAGYKARRAAHEEINQIMRRLRHCESTEEIAAWLVDSTSPFASRAALFEITSTMLRGIQARGFQPAQEGFEQIEIPLDRAPALAHCVREHDTVVAIGSPAEVSPELIAALAHAPDEKVYLYPVVIDGETVALLYATADGAAGRQFVDGAALELLTQAAATAARILTSAVTSRSERPSDLVQIEGLPGEIRADAGRHDETLRRAREARARWQARTAVSRIRVRHSAALKRGRAERNIYSALKPEIDAARRAYRQDFLAVSPTITDYLHREFIDLAHDDASLLGPDYPGSLS